MRKRREEGRVSEIFSRPGRVFKSWACSDACQLFSVLYLGRVVKSMGSGLRSPSSESLFTACLALSKLPNFSVTHFPYFKIGGTIVTL